MFTLNPACLRLGPFVPGPGPALHAPCTVKVLYLNPRPSVILGSGPGIDQALLVEARKVGVPLLQAKERAVGGWGRYLLVGDDTAFHAERPGAPWVQRETEREGGGREREHWGETVAVRPIINSVTWLWIFFGMQEEINLVMPMTLSMSHFSPRSFQRVDTILDLSLRDKKSTVPQTCTLSQRAINTDTFPLRPVLSSAVEFIIDFVLLFPSPA